MMFQLITYCTNLITHDIIAIIVYCDRHTHTKNETKIAKNMCLLRCTVVHLRLGIVRVLM